jgi:transcriptional regulator with XRE-family HTH domain/Zn-dependent peptidase ImmA (M78 family)
MQTRLNKDKATEAMRAAGLSQTDLATQLDVTKEAVSQWLNNKSFPRPNKLLKLGKLLSLSFDELVIKEDPFAPVVAFRKMKGTKTKDHHIEKAIEKGRFLKHLVPYLPFDTLEMPPVLKSPSVDYDYLQKVAQKVRAEINVSADETIDFKHLIRHFNELQAVLIPVFWGSKKVHENAVHIYLPDSQTTWVYLNLDVNIHDFKFWMAHELGHCLSPTLIGDNAENFADAFAGALLFPPQKAEQAYFVLSSLATSKAQLTYIIELAKKEIISPLTIYLQVNEFAKHTGKTNLDLDSEIHKWVANFNKNYRNVSELLFSDPKNLNAKDYLQRADEIFDTPFFDVLGQYLRENQKGAGVIQSIMDIPPLDARSIAEELT